MDGNFGGTNSNKVNIMGSGSSVMFDTNQAGNGAAQLPGDSVSSAEIADEPGVASIKSYETSSFNLTTTNTAFSSRTIVCPAADYVLVIASMAIDMNHVAGVSGFCTVGVSDNAGISGNNQDLSYYLPAAYGTVEATSGGLHVDPDDQFASARGI